MLPLYLGAKAAKGTLGLAKSALFSPDADEIQGQITRALSSKLNTPQAARQFGRSLVTDESPNGQTSGIEKGIGKAVVDELPNSQNLNTIPRILMGFHQGGIQGGLSQIGSAFNRFVPGFGPGGKSASVKYAFDLSVIPPQLQTQIGKAFEGSPAATRAADTVAPVVNKSFDNLVDKSILGQGLKWLASPEQYMKQMAEQAGATPIDNSPPGVQKG